MASQPSSHQMRADINEVCAARDDYRVAVLNAAANGFVCGALGKQEDLDRREKQAQDRYVRLEAAFRSTYPDAALEAVPVHQ